MEEKTVRLEYIGRCQMVFACTSGRRYGFTPGYTRAVFESDAGELLARIGEDGRPMFRIASVDKRGGDGDDAGVQGADSGSGSDAAGEPMGTVRAGSPRRRRRSVGSEL
ncbi:hypothetical protein [Thermogutta sp.]|uniref:hypothetical protein n=1 Tax=Thermogutta sp. TaxID=1962930 RepID=UPI00321F82C7